ncbi:MAG: hypothetical protein AAFU85_22580, partial [Planctomycetota bacterium]
GKPGANLEAKLAETDQTYGPTESFPFRSRIVPAQRSERSLRIWIASASHAHDSRVPANTIFPSQLGEKLESRGIANEILNASLPGNSLSDNEAELALRGPTWKPDVVLIYQMSTDLVGSTRDVPTGAPGTPRGLGAQLVDAMDALAERTTIFELLKSNVSSRITAASVLDRQLPDGAEKQYFESLNRLIERARSLGARPIVCTFCFSHAPSRLPGDYQLVLLKTAPTLDPVAWFDSITAWNKTLLSHPDLEVIDVAEGTSGEGEFFRDPVHFSVKGHEHVANRLAEYFELNVAQTAGSGDRE